MFTYLFICFLNFINHFIRYLHIYSTLTRVALSICFRPSLYNTYRIYETVDLDVVLNKLARSA